MSLAPGLYIHNIAELDGGNEPWRPASTPPPLLRHRSRHRRMGVGLPPQEGRRSATARGSSVCPRWRVVGLPPQEGRPTAAAGGVSVWGGKGAREARSEEHTSDLQSR